MSTVVKAAGMTSPLITTVPSHNHNRTFGDSPSCAGENLGPCDACYVDSSGRVLRAIMGQANAASAINDVQTMSAQGDVNPANYLAGSIFVVGYNGVYTPAQPADTGNAVSAGTLQTAVRLLSTLPTGANITITGTFPNFVFTGAGANAGKELDLFEVISSIQDTASQQPVVLTMTHTTVGQPAGTGSLTEASSRVRGFTNMSYKRGQPVSLYDAVEYAYSDGNLTPGQDLYLSGTVPGALDTAVTTTGQAPVGYAMDTQRVFVFAVC